MLVLSNTASQVLAPGQAMTFNSTIVKSGCNECHRANTGSVKLTTRGTYKISFAANITGAASSVLQMNIALGGSALPETTMITTPVSANALSNVATSTAVVNCCYDFSRITVVNTGTTSLTVGPNSSLVISKS